MAAPFSSHDEWIVVTSDWFARERRDALASLGITVDVEQGTVHAPFGPPGRVGSRVFVRHGRALYVAGHAGSGTYRIHE